MDQVGVLINKGTKVLTRVLNLYEEKSRSGQSLAPQELVDVFEEITLTDVQKAMELLQAFKPKSMPKERQGFLLPGQTASQTAKSLMLAFLETNQPVEQLPTADHLLNTLNVTDETLKRAFRTEYARTLPLLKSAQTKKWKVNHQMIFWSRMGQVLFYGLTALALLIVMRWIYEVIRDTVYDIRDSMANALKTFGKLIEAPSRAKNFIIGFFSRRRRLAVSPKSRTPEVRIRLRRSTPKTTRPSPTTWPDTDDL